MKISKKLIALLLALSVCAVMFSTAMTSLAATEQLPSFSVEGETTKDNGYVAPDFVTTTEKDIEEIVSSVVGGLDIPNKGEDVSDAINTGDETLSFFEQIMQSITDFFNKILTLLYGAF